MDIEAQAGTRGLKYAAGKGVAVVVMEPIRGGQLARKPPQVILDLWNTAPVKRTPADWALQWVWNQPEVSVVLSGMSTFEQVEQNLARADRSGAGTLTADDLVLVNRVRDAYRALCALPCTALVSIASLWTSRRCLRCPNTVHMKECRREAVFLPQDREQACRQHLEARGAYCTPTAFVVECERELGGDVHAKSGSRAIGSSNSGLYIAVGQGQS